MVSRPQSGQKKTMEMWGAGEMGGVTDSETLLNQQTHEMELSRPTNGGGEGSRAGQPEEEEKSFVASLHCFMKNRGTPIERIPHLGFKQINLWRIFKAVERQGGYDSVTSRRLWKSVYDELGGSPGSTSAATCTRRHYEKLVLPFERQIRGEEDKPLPTTRPRKQYKKSPEGKRGKAEGKRKRSQQEGDGEGCFEAQGSPGDASPCEAGKCPHSGRPRPDRCRPEGTAAVERDQPVPTCAVSQPTNSLFVSVHSSEGEIISPLEKKKRMAQASLTLSRAGSGPDEDSRGRPSVIRCALSPGQPRSRGTRESSEGSPVPHSSSSSRSPSPCSVSSEDCLAAPGPETGPEKPVPSAYVGNFTYSGSKPVSYYTSVKDSTAHLHHHGDIRQLFSNNLASLANFGKGRTPDWSPGYRGEFETPALKTFPATSSTSAEMGPKACWVPYHSSYPKALPKSGEYPGHKHHQGQRTLSPEDAKKLQMEPLHHGGAKERSKLGLPKPQPTQHSLPHPQAYHPMSYFVPGYERTRPVSAHQLKGLSLHPLLPSQPGSMYRHVMVGTPYAVPYESFARPHPCQIPFWHPQGGYAMAGLNPFYPNTKL